MELTIPTSSPDSVCTFAGSCAKARERRQKTTTKRNILFVFLVGQKQTKKKKRENERRKKKKTKQKDPRKFSNTLFVVVTTLKTFFIMIWLFLELYYFSHSSNATPYSFLELFFFVSLFLRQSKFSLFSSHHLKFPCRTTWNGLGHSKTTVVVIVHSIGTSIVGWERHNVLHNDLFGVLVLFPMAMNESGGFLPVWLMCGIYRSLPNQ